MVEWIKKSKFFNAGTLPQYSIYSTIPDLYSQYYEPETECSKCENKEWIDSEMKIIEDMNGYEFPKKKVHRCKKCDNIRMAKLKNEI